MTAAKTAGAQTSAPSWQGFKNILPIEGRKFVPYYLLIAAVLAAYSNVYDNSFLFDDEYLILKNEFLRHWSSIGKIFTQQIIAGADTPGSFYRPLQNLLYLLVYQFSGLSLFQYHLLNIALHAANACLVYTLGRKLGFKPGAVFLAALIWALHPLHVEAIAYISATADPLYALFCLLGVIIVLPDFTRRKILIDCPIFLLALLSKETAIIFPLLIMSCLYLLNEKRLYPKLYLRTWPLWLMVGLYIAARPLLLHMDDFQFFNQPNIYSQLYREHVLYRILTFLATLPDYLGLLVWPTGLHMDRDFPVYLHAWYPEVYAGIAIFAAAMGQIIWGRAQRGLALSWGLLWFASAHILHTGILVPANSLFLEHWMYLPSAGLFLGVMETLALCFDHRRLQKYKSAGITATLLIAAMLGVLTYNQNATWHDPEIFYNRIFSYGETSARAHNNLGNFYTEQGDYKKALEQYRLGIKTADTHPELHLNIALLLLNLPDRESHVGEAIDELKRSIEIDPDYFLSYEALAVIYGYLKDREKESYYRNRAEEIHKKLIH